jgi:hypothetical protein
MFPFCWCSWTEPILTTFPQQEKCLYTTGRITPVCKGKQKYSRHAVILWGMLAFFPVVLTSKFSLYFSKDWFRFPFFRVKRFWWLHYSNRNAKWISCFHCMTTKLFYLNQCGYFNNKSDSFLFLGILSFISNHTITLYHLST